MVEETDAYGKHGRAMLRGGLTPGQRQNIADGKPPGPGRTDHQEQVQRNRPPWPEGAPCTSCGRPCAGDRARRRDPGVRERYLRHVAHGLCVTCYRTQTPEDQRKTYKREWMRAKRAREREAS